MGLQLALLAGDLLAVDVGRQLDVPHCHQLRSHGEACRRLLERLGLVLAHREAHRALTVGLKSHVPIVTKLTGVVRGFRMQLPPNDHTGLCAFLSKT